MFIHTLGSGNVHACICRRATVVAELQVERFRAKGLKRVKREDAQGRLNVEMANVRNLAA